MTLNIGPVERCLIRWAGATSGLVAAHLAERQRDGVGVVIDNLPHGVSSSRAIARATGLPRSSVKSALRRLKALGIYRPAPHGPNRQVVHRILFTAVVCAIDQDLARAASEASAKVPLQLDDVNVPTLPSELIDAARTEARLIIDRPIEVQLPLGHRTLPDDVLHLLGNPDEWASEVHRGTARVGDIRPPGGLPKSTAAARVGDIRPPGGLPKSTAAARVGDIRPPGGLPKSTAAARVGDIRPPGGLPKSTAAARVGDIRPPGGLPKSTRANTRTQTAHARAPSGEGDLTDLTDLTDISSSIKSESGGGEGGPGEGEEAAGRERHGRWAAALVSLGLDGFSIVDRFPAGELGDVDLGLLGRIEHRLESGDVNNREGYVVETLRNELERPKPASSERETAVRERAVYDPQNLDPETQVIFDGVKAELRDRVTTSSFATWASQLVGVARRGSTFVIGAPDEFTAEMVEHRMFTLLVAELERATGKPWNVVIEVAPPSG